VHTNTANANSFIQGGTGRKLIVESPTVLGNLTVTQDDTEIEVQPGAAIGDVVLFTSPGFGAVSRIYVQGGGTMGQFFVQTGSSDTVVDGMQLDVPTSSAFLGDFNKAAIVNNLSLSFEYFCFLAQNTGSNDVVIAGNNAKVVAPATQATIRLPDACNRIVVFDNWLENDTHHNFRVHGTSTHVWFAQNQVRLHGLAMAELVTETPHLGSVWLVGGNDFFMNTIGDIQWGTDGLIDYLRWMDNNFYSDTIYTSEADTNSIGDPVDMSEDWVREFQASFNGYGAGPPAWRDPPGDPTTI
jgi:hypothetical protein